LLLYVHNLLLIRFAAVAERGDRAQIYVYDLRTFRKRKTLSNADILSKVYF